MSRLGDRVVAFGAWVRSARMPDEIPIICVHMTCLEERCRFCKIRLSSGDQDYGDKRGHLFPD